jgi:hypothetical protein
MFCYLMPVIGKTMISWFYVEHIEIKTKTVNIIHFPIGPKKNICLFTVTSSKKNRVGRSDFHFILFFHFISHTEIPDYGPIRIRKRYRTLEYI